MIALLLVACDGPAPTDTTDTSGGGGEDVTFSDIVITPVATMPTQLDVTFTTDSTEAGWVSFGPDGEEGWTATATSTGDGTWSARLVGLPAGTASWVTVGAGDAVGPDTPVTTEDPPAWIDLLETSEGTPTKGFLAVGISAAEGNGGAILDTHGRPVWWYQTPAGVVPTIRTRARVSPDLDEVWFNAFNVGPAGGNGDGEAVLVRVAMDGSTSEIVEAAYNHHDFLVHADGTVAYVGVDQRDVDGMPIRGDTITEIATDGTESVIWSAWDTFTYSGAGEDTWWTLANHLEHHAATDTYTIGMRNLGTLAHVQRATGETLWTVGAPGSTYPVDDVFVMQHGFDVLDDGVLVFDNGPAGELDSRAVRYTFGDDTATVAWEYHADPPLYSFVMGDVHALDNGGARVVFSTAADVREVDEAGTVTSHFTYTDGTVIGFAEFWPSLVE